MKPRAGGIQQEACFILHDRKLDLMDRPRLFKPRNMINTFEPLYHRFLDDRLAITHAEKR